MEDSIQNRDLIISAVLEKLSNGESVAVRTGTANEVMLQTAGEMEVDSIRTELACKRLSPGVFLLSLKT